MLILDSHSMKDLLHVLLLDPFKKISTKIFRCFCFLHKQQKKKKATRSDSFVFVYFFPSTYVSKDLLILAATTLQCFRNENGGFNPPSISLFPLQFSFSL